MLPILHIGPLAIQLPGLLLLLGLWLGLSLAEKHSRRSGVSANQIYTITLVALLSAAFSARAVYVFCNITAFIDSPGGIFSLNKELLDPWGGILGACLPTLYFIRRYKLSAWSLIDALTPILAVLMIAIHLSNLASGNGYGLPSSLPWAIFVFGEWRHPTQVYELITAVIILVIFWPGKPRTHNNPKGLYTLHFIAASAGSRLFFEAFRGDSTIIRGGFRNEQVISWLILALILWLISRRIQQGTSNQEPIPLPFEGSASENGEQ
jgi:phosphatidylglycerol:prolipoprotein diacylglycerol transferase